MGGHFDCFSSATGAVDDGSGFAPAMEAIRLVAAAGGRPKRSIVVILFAAEEIGLVGSQAWLKNHPGVEAKISMMINRDGSPSAITGAVVPETWLADLAKIAAPLAKLNPKWPFKLERGVPRAHATSPGGTDSSSFEMLSVPTLRFTTQSDYNYRHAWHTLHDLYSELVPYTEHQQAFRARHRGRAYGAANLEKALPAEGVYLADGLYADLAIGAADAPVHIMTSLDFVNAPSRRPTSSASSRVRAAPSGGRAPAVRLPACDPADLPEPARAGDPAHRQDRRPQRPRRRAHRLRRPEVRRRRQPALVLNAAIKHDAAGVLGVSVRTRST